MDQGNHYKKCDLQVHSPRDINWKGDSCVTPEERKAYSKTFVKECREAGINAVAVTDHHDMVFFEYIKAASKAELDEGGDLVPNDQQLVVFPGIELTFNQPPMQGLLILDASFPEALFPTVLGSLSLAQAAKEDSKTIQTVGISSNTINSIGDIYRKLDGTDGVKGRYIFLPHVKDGGHKTLMRDGFHEAYAKMPSVGGYVDGKFEGGGVGYLKILNGEVDAWGFKTIAVIQTTDYRADETLANLDTATWIKWREPTAEALRQACLAKESRISLVEPELPNIFIEKIDVTNSSFLSKFDLDLNPQLNSIIGGRGSGKSTILEYLRWALCDQTEGFGKEGVQSDILKRRNTLIDKTLKEVDGEVRVFFIVNGTRHIVKRNPKSEDVLLKIGDRDFESVRPSQIQDLLPIQAYSQKQLSSISVRSDELRRFIEQPISKEIEDIDSKVGEALVEVKSAYQKLSKSKELYTDLRKNEIEIGSFKSQIEKLRGGLKGISEGDKKILDRAKYYVNEKNRFDEVSLECFSIQDSIRPLKELLEKYKGKASDSSETFENEDILKGLNESRSKLLEEALNKVQELEKLRSDSVVRYEELRANWLEIRNAFELEYKNAKEKSTSSQSTLTAIKELEQKIEKLELVIRQKQSLLSEVDMTDEVFNNLYESYINLQISKIDRLKNSTEIFTRLSDGLIKADFTKTIDVEKMHAEINSVFSTYSLNINKSRTEKLAELVSNSSVPLIKWKEAVYELKALSEFNSAPDVQDELPHTPVLDSTGFSSANRKKMSEALTSEGLLRLASIKLDFLPKFSYQTDSTMDDEIPFEEASAGQQATALLNVLLNQDGFPLIIDQPEDDIDNRAIEKIITNLWGSKKKRQIIISSHNANLVVNGDSELVICCDYNETSEQTKGHIKYEGSIDRKEIKNEIISIMEGGERAFKLRKEKYGV
ncbi:chromosome segregation protein [Bathymodiolus japonicus methanotrophic gill symbiont]|uniref:TrlF family AAA-like ATPase n=1 Tax=Bathymodiolus japonicus methanotrophic gill symbiont TaxID=113269 RepID=UPI001B559D31|nr:AAA family ATPase [Bathymodiolus japonicus methanotrophic gill symbiont]GFO73639.1 chromosome segregation protein [Bathymodiolus japonicus methanotrophic gill symbiont]